MNQTKHCWQNYVDYHKCITAKGEDFAPCRQFMLAYRSLCPSGWTTRWDDQRGEFPHVRKTAGKLAMAGMSRSTTNVTGRGRKLSLQARPVNRVMIDWENASMGRAHEKEGTGLVDHGIIILGSMYIICHGQHQVIIELRFPIPMESCPTDQVMFGARVNASSIQGHDHLYGALRTCSSGSQGFHMYM